MKRRMTCTASDAPRAPESQAKHTPSGLSRTYTVCRQSSGMSANQFLHTLRKTARWLKTNQPEHTYAPTTTMKTMRTTANLADGVRQNMQAATMTAVADEMDAAEITEARGTDVTVDVAKAVHLTADVHRAATVQTEGALPAEKVRDTIRHAAEADTQSATKRRQKNIVVTGVFILLKRRRLLPTCQRTSA